LRAQTALKSVTLGFSASELGGISEESMENFYQEVEDLKKERSDLEIKWREE